MKCPFQAIVHAVTLSPYGRVSAKIWVFTLCGIAGFCDLANVARTGDAPSEDHAVLVAMMDTLRHRGPDGDGTFVTPQCALGHLRLRIIDLSERARQPMRAADDRTVITFNGEIYNFRELRDELAARVDFRSTSDTEVLLEGYVAWGNDVFARANGMFALAIWDEANKRLVLARDRLGKKPLFYYWDGRGTVVFASELKALLRHPSVQREIDPESLALYFTFGFIPSTRTIFRNVFKVPAGCTVSFDGQRRSIAAFWTLATEEHALSETDALDRLDSLLTDAVRIRLESDVPLGFFLSGGIDSSLVTAIGRKLAGDIRTYTVGFTDEQYDERPHARAIAEHLGTRHTEIVIDDDDLSSFIGQAATYFDEPFADSSLIATYYLSRATRQHVTVALSGDGGDELFCGYPKYAQLHAMRHVMKLPARARALTGRLLGRVPGNRARKIGHALQSTSVDELARWLSTIWKRDELHALLPGVSDPWQGSTAAATWRRYAHRDPVTRMMASDITSYLRDGILQKVDRASMAVALETRAPLLDYRVVDFALSLPLDLKYRERRGKYLLRRLLERYVPSKLWASRPKQGFEIPVKQWYRSGRRRALGDAIRAVASAFPGLLDEHTMTAIAETHFAGRIDYSQKLFTLDMLGEWAKEYT